jgi:DNA polymerase eta
VIFPTGSRSLLLLLLQEPGTAGVSAWWCRPASSWRHDEQLLAAGAVVVAQLRAAVAQQLGFSCSAGIAHSKILAKLGSGKWPALLFVLLPAFDCSGGTAHCKVVAKLSSGE